MKNISTSMKSAIVNEDSLRKISYKISNLKYKKHKYKQYVISNRNSFKCPLCKAKKEKATVFNFDSKTIICCCSCMMKIIDSKNNPSNMPIKNNNVKPFEKGKKLINIWGILTSDTNQGNLLWSVRKSSDADIEYVKYVALTPSVLGKDLSITKTVKDGLTKYVMSYDNKRMVFKSLGKLENAIWRQNPEVIPVTIRKKTKEEIEAERAAREKEAIELEEEARRKKELQRQILEHKTKEKHHAKLLAEKALQEKQKLQSEENIKKKVAKEAREQEENAKKKTVKEAKEREGLEKLPQIGVHDFVVRRNVFKCMHASHKLENIVAAVNIIDKNNEEKLFRINAGYCTDCNIFFIMESSYEKLKHKGIPICRVSDEKTYMKNYSVNGMLLAQESILMQYGYNVNQQEGLSTLRRQKILAVLIDKKILSKSEIISYLDFFISQRQTQSKYQIAISKWEHDREFVENYRIGEYHQYGVNAIYR